MIFKTIQIGLFIAAFYFIFTLMEENDKLREDTDFNLRVHEEVIKHQKELTDRQNKIIRILTLLKRQ
jgi:hypothetical protein